MDEELKKTIDVSASVKTIQTDLLALKKDREVTRSDTSNLQGSDTVSGNGPAKKRKRSSEDDNESEEEDKDLKPGDTDTELYQLSEAAGAFIEMTFKSKLDNATSKASATKYGVPESMWLKCPKLDPVISTTVSTSAHRADRSASRLQQFLPHATNPLVNVLERAEKLNLPAQAIAAIQTSLQLMSNANQHNSIARRNALLMQLNPQLKQLVEDVDF